MRHDEQVRVIKEMCAHLDGDTNVDAGGLRQNPTITYTGSRPGTSSTPAQFVAATINDDFQFRPGGVNRQVDQSGTTVRPDQRPPHIRRQPGDPDRRAGSGHGCVLRVGGQS